MSRRKAFEGDICERRKVSIMLDSDRSFWRSFESRLTELSQFLSSICFLPNANV